MVETNQTGGLWPSLYTPFRTLGSKVADWLSPASDASSDDSAYRISIELPGVAETDIDLQVHNGVVSVTGEKSTSREDKGETWFFSEREFGAFRRSFRLPPDAVEDKVEAHMKDGVLMITVPRQAAGTTGGRKVQIKTGTE